MAVRAAFPGCYTFQRTPFSTDTDTFQRTPFSTDTDILDFFPNYFYTVFALSSGESLDMPRTESSSAISQGYSDFYSLLSAITFLGLSLGSQIKNEPGPPINGPHNNNLKTNLNFIQTKSILSIISKLISHTTHVFVFVFFPLVAQFNNNLKQI